MNRLYGACVRLRELHQGLHRGQTMSEYALILAAIAVGVFLAYRGMGEAINQMVTWQSIDRDLLTPLGL